MTTSIPASSSQPVTAPAMETPKPQAAAPEAPVFTMLGQSDNVCVDGVCAVPQA